MQKAMHNMRPVRTLSVGRSQMDFFMSSLSSGYSYLEAILYQTVSPVQPALANPVDALLNASQRLEHCALRRLNLLQP